MYLISDISDVYVKMLENSQWQSGAGFALIRYFYKNAITAEKTNHQATDLGIECDYNTMESLFAWVWFSRNSAEVYISIYSHVLFISMIKISSKCIVRWNI